MAGIGDYIRKCYAGEGRAESEKFFAPLPEIPKVPPYNLKRVSDGWYYQGLEGSTEWPTEVWTPHKTLAMVLCYERTPREGEVNEPVDPALTKAERGAVL